MTQNNPTINVSVTFRHTNSTDALKEYAIEKINHCLTKYIHNNAEVHVSLSVEKRDHTAEVIVHAKPYELTGKATTDDLYAAIDKVSDTILAQLRKQKGRHLDSVYHPAEVKTVP